MKKEFSIVVLLTLATISYAQVSDSLKINIGGIENQELQDLSALLDIGYLTVDLFGSEVIGNHFLLISKEYKGNELVKIDTIVNTKAFNLKNDSDTVRIRFATQKPSTDSVKVQFGLPRFSTSKKYGTTASDKYALIPVSQEKGTCFSPYQSINLLAYSTPYPIPNYPGAFSYCELNSNGTDSENWGQKYGIDHYIVFSIQQLKGSNKDNP